MIQFDNNNTSIMEERREVFRKTPFEYEVTSIDQALDHPLLPSTGKLVTASQTLTVESKTFLVSKVTPIVKTTDR